MSPFLNIVLVLFSIGFADNLIDHRCGPMCPLRGGMPDISIDTPEIVRATA